MSRLKVRESIKMEMISREIYCSILICSPIHTLTTLMQSIGNALNNHVSTQRRVHLHDIIGNIHAHNIRQRIGSVVHFARRAITATTRYTHNEEHHYGNYCQ